MRGFLAYFCIALASFLANNSVFACLPSDGKVNCPCVKDSDCIIQLNCPNCGNAVPLPPTCDKTAGKCLNPYRDGCFRKKLSTLDNDIFPMKQCSRQGTDPKRICLDESDRKIGRCNKSPTGELFRDREIYIAPQNWLSANLVADAAQIFMVEYMNFPVLYKYGSHGEFTSKGFYEEHVEIPLYARTGISSYDLDAIKNGGCNQKIREDIACKCTDSRSNCAHVQFEIGNRLLLQLKKCQPNVTLKRGGCWV